MAPSSLQKQCTNAAIRNLNRIDEDGLGVTPWRLLKPILNKCENPKMLREWEKNTPQIRGETGEIWLKFIKRDVPNWRNKTFEPSNPESWWKVYKKLKAEADMEESRAEKMLMDKMSKIKKHEAEWKVAPPTTAIPERKGRNKGVAMQFQRGSDNNGLRFTTGSKTKDFMQSVRRQAAESKLQRSGVLARPTKFLNDGTAIRKPVTAPRHMVEDKQRQADLARHSAPQIADGSLQRPTPPRMSLASRAARDLKVREERLKAIRDEKSGLESMSNQPSGELGPIYSRTSNVLSQAPASVANAKTPATSLRAGRAPGVSNPAMLSQSSTLKPSVQRSVPGSSSKRMSAISASDRPSSLLLAGADETYEPFDNSSVLSSTKKHNLASNERRQPREPDHQPSSSKSKRLSASPKASASTSPITQEKLRKASSHSDHIPKTLLGTVASSNSTSNSGLKRRAGPTILLPVKRAKR